MLQRYQRNPCGSFDTDLQECCCCPFTSNNSKCAQCYSDHNKPSHDNKVELSLSALALCTVLVCYILQRLPLYNHLCLTYIPGCELMRGDSMYFTYFLYMRLLSPTLAKQTSQLLVLLAATTVASAQNAVTCKIDIH